MATFPAVDAPSMVSPKFPHPLGVDVGVFLRLDANEKMADSGISNKPFRDAPTASLVLSLCAAAGDSRDSWMYLDVLVNEGLGEHFLPF